MEFQYSDNEQKTFNFLALTVHTRPNIATTYQEIDNFKYNLNELTSEPCFLTENAIILGDFNQSPSYVGKCYLSWLDLDADFKEIQYTGSSSSRKPDDDKNRLDRG